MKYFIIEGILKNTEKMNDEIMKEHMAYTGKAMEQGLVLVSGLKENMSGGSLCYEVRVSRKNRSLFS